STRPSASPSALSPSAWGVAGDERRPPQRRLPPRGHSPPVQPPDAPWAAVSRPRATVSRVSHVRRPPTHHGARLPTHTVRFVVPDGTPVITGCPAATSAAATSSGVAVGLRAR